MIAIGTSLALAFLAQTASEPAGTRLKAACERLVAAPSITFTMTFPWPSEGRDAPTLDGIGLYRRVTGQNAIVKYEAGKPVQLQINQSIELFLFEDRLRVGRIGDQPFQRITGDLERRWPWNNVVAGLAAEPLPRERLLAILPAIGEAEPDKRGAEEFLVAWLGAENFERVGAREPADPSSVAPHDFLVVARMDSTGTAELNVYRDGPPKTPDTSSYACTTFTPSNVGATRVDVPPAVLEIARAAKKK